MKNLKISQKLLLLVSIAVFTFLFTVSFTLYKYYYLLELHNYRDLALSVEENLFKMEDAENIFVIQESATEEFYTNGQSESVKIVNEIQQILKAELPELQKANEHTGHDITPIVN